MTRAGPLAAATRWATSSSSVDLPTPGSPATRSTAPGTRPPPRTRSNSGMPVGTARAPASSTSAIGRAGAVTGPAETERSAAAGAPISWMLPHVWHSGQRPTHLAEAYPHSEQRWAGRADFTPAGGTPATLTPRADSFGGAGGGRGPRGGHLFGDSPEGGAVSGAPPFWGEANDEPRG